MPRGGGQTAVAVQNQRERGVHLGRRVHAAGALGGRQGGADLCLQAVEAAVVDGVGHRLDTGLQKFGHGPSQGRGYAPVYRAGVADCDCRRGAGPCPMSRGSRPGTAVPGERG